MCDLATMIFYQQTCDDESPAPASYCVHHLQIITSTFDKNAKRWDNTYIFMLSGHSFFLKLVPRHKAGKESCHINSLFQNVQKYLNVCFLFVRQGEWF